MHRKAKAPKVLRAFYGAGNAEREAAGLDAEERPQSVLTPAEIVTELARTAGPLILDPCTTPSNPLGAAVWCCGPGQPGGDGLALKWPRWLPSHHPAAHSGWTINQTGLGFTWVNPPFGKDFQGDGAFERWMAKCAAEGQAGARIWAIGPLRTHRHGIIPALATADHVWTTWPIYFPDENGNPPSGGFAFPCFIAGWNVPEPDRVMYHATPGSKGRDLRTGRLRVECL